MHIYSIERQNKLLFFKKLKKIGGFKGTIVK